MQPIAEPQRVARWLGEDNEYVVTRADLAGSLGGDFDHFTLHGNVNDHQDGEAVSGASPCLAANCSQISHFK
jgi:hypothetical protein